MVLRVVVVAVTFLAFFFVLYNFPWVQQTICYPSILATVCSGIYSQQEWDLFYHLGGNGPWIPRTPEGDVTRLPLKCEVEQVHMMSRHAERFPTVNAGARHLGLLQRLQAKGVKLSGNLDFVKDWKYFTNFDDPDFENLTTEGPYAGTVQATNTGRKLRKQYDKLIDSERTTKLWSCGSHRDIETAKHFANGFFGSKWEQDNSAQLVIIPETTDRGADTLTPGSTCLRYMNDKVYGHDRGYGELNVWQNVFTKPIISRLKEDAGGLALTPIEIYSMMEMCGFETLAVGSSRWCDIFSQEEWLDFEYGRDLLHFYRAGSGNEFAGAMGWLWLNATTTLMANETARGIYFSFVHDGDIVPLLTTLGILDETSNASFLPNDKRKDKRRWRTSDVVPMGGRLIFEKVTCSNTGVAKNLRRTYVRLFINDGVFDLEKRMKGGGLAYSVGFAQWADMVRKKGEQFGKFKEVCGLDNEAPSSITFLQPQYQ
ncbi:hypothetical protein LTR05_000934 [Lithohypha guttulata]|uniref:Phosphoglycerate mutase-like protein n=1 Tax=Lithohypha guttulata TaxID=1690604 RepID=A0AAN7T5W6_9EURO|nr:hypothetical protein LTR05_000934 [Lithohypha guttulata]